MRYSSLVKRVRKSSRPVLGRSSRPRERIHSGPDIKLGYARIGRETLAAIAEELEAAAGDELTPPERVRAFARAASSPEISVRETLAGRETLGAIAQELRSGAVRNPLNTKPYGDRISNAPGASVPGQRHLETSPEISVHQSPIGRETLAAINEELREPSSDEPITGVRARKASTEQDAPSSSVYPANAIDVFEMMTFVARGEVSELASMVARRAFVEQRLLHRLPVASMAQVDRIDVTPWTVKGTVIVRVWCSVPTREESSQLANG